MAKKTRRHPSKNHRARKAKPERDFFERLREYRKKHPDPPGTAEEIEYIKKQNQLAQWSGRMLDYVTAIRDGLQPPPWLEKYLGYRTSKTTPVTTTTVEKTEAEVPAKKKSQIDRVCRVLPKLYPPDGKVPANIDVETVRGKVANKLALESKELAKADPSWNTVDRAIKRIGRRAD